MEAFSDVCVGLFFNEKSRDFSPDRLGDLAMLLDQTSLSNRYSATHLARLGMGWWMAFESRT